MDEKQLLKRLRTAFATEASERLESLSGNLLKLENLETVEEQAPALEVVYREAHSLKGAARAVNYNGIEALCMTMESVFAHIKKESVVVPEAFFDLGQDCVAAIRDFMDNLDGESSSSGEKLEALTERLNRFLERKESRESTKTGVPARPQSDSEAALGPECVMAENGGRASRDASSETDKKNRRFRAEPVASKNRKHDRSADASGLRIASEKLDAILRRAEEMIGLKLASESHLENLRKLRDVVDSSFERRGKICEFLKTRMEPGRPKRFLPNGESEKLARFVEAEQEEARYLAHEIRDMAAFFERYRRSLAKLTGDLLEETKSAMLRPCADLFDQFPIMVREIARESGKKVQFELQGTHIEIDRRILERMKDPLLHLIRNAIDHGIEPPEERKLAGKSEKALLRLSGRQNEGKTVEMVLCDDGRGIDADAVKKRAVERGLLTAPEADELSRDEAVSLIFKSGVSTAPLVTEISGRGLGMAIVSERIEILGGTLSIESKPGEGTVFHMRLPATLATFRGVMVECGRQVFVIPSTHVRKVIRVYNDEIKTAENRRIIAYRDRATSLADLSSALKIPGTKRNEDADFFPAVVVCAADTIMALRVDQVLGEEEILVKDLGKQLKRVPFVSAATILGSGKPALILNAKDLLQSRPGEDFAPFQTDAQETVERPKVLLVEDSITSRMLLKNMLESAGFDVFAAVDGGKAFAMLPEVLPDIVVSDVEMPEMDGFELTRKIRQSPDFESLPVVLVTTLSSQKDRETGIEAGANAYVVKSEFDQQNLLETIRLWV